MIEQIHIAVEITFNEFLSQNSLHMLSTTVIIPPLQRAELGRAGLLDIAVVCEWMNTSFGNLFYFF